MVSPATLAGVATALEHVAAELRAVIERAPDADAPPIERDLDTSTETVPASWRERIWVVPPETRLTMREATEALDCSRSWLAARLHPPAGARTIPIPHRKRDGVLIFTAGEIRTWMVQTETIGQLGAMETAIERATTRLRQHP